MQLIDHLPELSSEVQAFECRRGTLVADLVILALAKDLIETAVAVQDTAQTDLPHKAYPNARLAFEIAQNIVVLATHEDYAQAGAVAWVYFESKDAPWRTALANRRRGESEALSEDEWLNARVRQMAGIWDSMSPGQGDRLTDALATVRRDRKMRPDNWLHQSFAQRQSRAYELFAMYSGGSPSDESLEINEALYQGLCRETHARPRLDTFGFIKGSSDDLLQLDIAPRNLDQARHVALSSTDLSAWESVAALRWQRTGTV